MAERPWLSRVIPFAIYMAFVILADMLSRLGWSATELRWLYSVKIAAVLAALLYWRRDYVELFDFRLGWRAAMCSLVVGLVVLLLWISLNASWMVVGDGGGGFDPRDNGVIDWRLVAVRLTGASLVVPVMEELFWRSFLLRWLASPDFLQVDPARVKLQYFVVTVLLFGVEHSQWLAGVVAGAAYVVLYARTRNLWSAVLAHAVTNAVLGVWIISTGQWTYW